MHAWQFCEDWIFCSRYKWVFRALPKNCFVSNGIFYALSEVPIKLCSHNFVQLMDNTKIPKKVGFHGLSFFLHG